MRERHLGRYSVRDASVPMLDVRPNPRAHVPHAEERGSVRTLADLNKLHAAHHARRARDGREDDQGDRVEVHVHVGQR
jgi:hypothetical protein